MLHKLILLLLHVLQVYKVMMSMTKGYPAGKIGISAVDF